MGKLGEICKEFKPWKYNPPINNFHKDFYWFEIKKIGERDNSPTK